MQTIEQRIDDWIASHRDEELAFLSTLVKTPSEVVPPVGGEAACQALVANGYRAAGAGVDVFSPIDVPGLREHPAYHGEWDGVPRSLEGRPVVVGVFRGTGGGRSILFSAHVDTVPGGDPKNWKEAGPFSGMIKDGNLFGRGSWDTKWGIAAGLYAARCARACASGLRGDILLESVTDEEFGGSHGTLASRLRGYNSDIAINAEPTNMITAPVHRGGTAWKLTLKGDPGRGFAGQKITNPVLKLARVIEAVQAYDRARSPFSNPPRFYESDPGLPTYIQQVTGGGTTLAESIGSPAECTLSLWTEEHPGMDEETHRRNFISFINAYLDRDAEFDGVYPEYLQQFRFIPGSEIDPAHPFFESLERSFRSAGIAYRVGGAMFACDTYVFNLYSPTPALTLGPRGGNAHAADEFVLVEDVIDLTRVYARAILDWCG
jgi:acetylornithine deacetylase